MARMVRTSKTLSWSYCPCCSFDTQSQRGRSKTVARRVVRRIAKRREARIWRREMGE